MVILPGSYESRNCRKIKKFFIMWRVRIIIQIFSGKKILGFFIQGNPVNQFSKAINICIPNIKNNIDDDNMNAED